MLNVKNNQPQRSQRSQRDGGLRVIGLAGQGAGGGYNGDVHHKETKTRRDVGIHKEVAEVMEGRINTL